MATRNEALRYNRDQVYPAAGYNILYTKSLSAADTVLGSDCFVELDSSILGFTVSLTAQPYVGEQHHFQDNTGYCAANPITVSGNGNNINGAATALINTSYGSITVRWNGTQWIIIGKV